MSIKSRGNAKCHNLTDNRLYFLFILASTVLYRWQWESGDLFYTDFAFDTKEGTVHLAQTAWLSSSNYIGYLVGALSLLKSKRHSLFVVLGLTLVYHWLASRRFWLVTGVTLLAGVASAWVLVSISAFAINWLKSRQVASRWFDLYGCRYRYHPHRIDL